LRRTTVLATPSPLVEDSVDRVLIHRVGAGLLARIDPLHPGGKAIEDRVGDEVVVHDDVGHLEDSGSLQRQEARIARAGPTRYIWPPVMRRP
jgi:hypothetical protein